MKRFALMAVLCAFVLSAATASAAELKATGGWAIEFLWKDNWNFMNDGMASTFDNGHQFRAIQQFDTTFHFTANENLKGVLQTRISDDWGNGAYSIGSTAGTVNVKQAYIDFNWPGTEVNVKAGFFPVALPSAIGTSYILNEEVAALTVGGSITDNVGYLAGYARAAAAADATTAASRENYQDVYFAAMPLTFDGFAFAPFFAYANIGQNVGTATVAGLKPNNWSATPEVESAWWIGSSFTMDMFDPFVIKADFNYGTTDAKNKSDERSGWLGALALEYTGLDFMTPEVFFVYTSGEDKDAGESERMPVLDSGFAVGTFFFGGDWGIDGSISDDVNSLGFWTLGASFKGISFLEGLSHDVIVMYIKGTNDKDMVAGNNRTYGRTLTEKDSIWEVDLNSSYTIYDELTAYVQLGWLNADYDQDVWGANYKGGDAYKVSVGVAYSF